MVLSFPVPQGVTMMIDAGAIFKVRGSRLVAGSQGTGTDCQLLIHSSARNSAAGGFLH